MWRDRWTKADVDIWLEEKGLSGQLRAEALGEPAHEVLLLSGVDLDVQEGEFIALIDEISPTQIIAPTMRPPNSPKT